MIDDEPKMPFVKDVIPSRFLKAPYNLMGAETVLDIVITDTKINNGSPCSGHADIFANWPGDEAFVRQWFVLENGQAMGINETPDGDWTFPVVECEL